MIDVSWNTIIALVFRHLLFSSGTWLVGHGYLQSSAMEAFIGAGTMFGGIAWSIWQKQGQAALVAELRGMADYWRNRNKPQTPPASKP